MQFDTLFEAGNENKNLIRNYLSMEEPIRNALNIQPNIEAKIVLPSYEYILRSFPIDILSPDILNNNNSKPIEYTITGQTLRSYLTNSILSQSSNGMSVNRINFSDINKYENQQVYENAVKTDSTSLDNSIKNAVRKNTLFIAMIKISSLMNTVAVVYDPLIKNRTNDNKTNVKSKHISDNHLHSLCVNIQGFEPFNCNIEYLKSTSNKNGKITSILTEKIVNVLHTALTDNNGNAFKFKFEPTDAVQIADLVYSAFVNGREYKQNNMDVTIFYPVNNIIKYMIEPITPGDNKTDFRIRPRNVNESYTNLEGLDDLTYTRLFKFC